MPIPWVIFLSCLLVFSPLNFNFNPWGRRWRKGHALLNGGSEEIANKECMSDVGSPHLRLHQVLRAPNHHCWLQPPMKAPSRWAPPLEVPFGQALGFAPAPPAHQISGISRRRCTQVPPPCPCLLMPRPGGDRGAWKRWDLAGRRDCTHSLSECLSMLRGPVKQMEWSIGPIYQSASNSACGVAAL